MEGGACENVNMGGGAYDNVYIGGGACENVNMGGGAYNNVWWRSL